MMPAVRLPRRLRVALKRLAYGGVGASDEGARAVEWLDIRPGSRIADIGSGFGAFAFRFARATGPSGVVYAVDTDPDLRDEVGRDAALRGLSQVRPVAAAEDHPSIPEPVDLVFLSSSFHHLPDRVAYFRAVRSLLRPGARVVILENRPGPLTGLFGHATDPAAVRSTLESAGFRAVASADLVRSAALQAFVPADDAPAGAE